MHLLILYTVKEYSISVRFWQLNRCEFKGEGRLSIDLKLGESFKRFVTERMHKIIAHKAS